LGCGAASPRTSRCRTYVVTAEELQLAKEEAAVLGDSMPDPNDPHNIRWHLTWVVEKFCGCRSYAERITKRKHILRDIVNPAPPNVVKLQTARP
jgi:hypothetical protein